MLSRFLLFTFVALFACQTIAVVFDIHAPHQMNVSHNSNIQHDSHQESATALEDSTTLDCHHCCHCHTPTSIAVLDTDDNSVLVLKGEKQIISNFSADSATISPEHRPPIA